MKIRTSLVIVAVAAVVAPTALSARQAQSNVTAQLTAAQVVPHISAPGASARLDGTLTKVKGGWQLSYTFTFRRLTSRALIGTVRLGATGETGPIAIVLCSGRCRSGLHQTVGVSPKVFRAITAGGAYVNLTTKRHPNGEVRGQLTKSS